MDMGWNQENLNLKFALWTAKLQSDDLASPHWWLGGEFHREGGEVGVGGVCLRWQGLSLSFCIVCVIFSVRDAVGVYCPASKTSSLLFFQILSVSGTGEHFWMLILKCLELVVLWWTIEVAKERPGKQTWRSGRAGLWGACLEAGRVKWSGWSGKAQGQSSGWQMMEICQKASRQGVATGRAEQARVEEPSLILRFWD